MKRFLASLWVVLMTGMGIELHAMADMDVSTRRALELTQKLLRDPTEREKVFLADPASRKNDSDLARFTGSEANQQELYEIAAVIFESVVAEANGDPVQLEKAINSAMKDPAQFYRKLKESDQSRIKKLAEKIESAQAKASQQKSVRPK